MIRSRVTLQGRPPGEIASIRWNENGAITAIRVQIGRHLTDWISATSHPALHSQLQSLASKLRGVTASMEGRAQDLIERLAKVDNASADAIARAHVELEKTDAAARSVEDLINRLSNGGPPLEEGPGERDPR
jgi:hypothetical protein